MQKQTSLAFILLHFFAISFTSLLAQTVEDGLPFITNFSKNQYRFHNQNWAIEQDNRGVMYFGNNSGLMYFNGNKWDLFEFEVKSRVYSIAKNNLGRIYFGSMGEFGYIEPTNDGTVKYISLSNKFSQKTSGCTEVLSTLVNNNAIYFCTHEAVYKYINDVLISVYKPSKGTTFHKFFLHNNVFYLRENNTGLLKEENGKLIFEKNSELFSDKKIDFILQIKSHAIIGTRNNGLFKWTIENNKNIFTPICSPLNTTFIKADIYCGIKLTNGNIAIGTLKNGIYILDENTNLKNHFDKTTGLNNDKIHYLFEDINQNIWAALDKGISLIEYNSPFLKYDETLGLEGNVNSCITFNKLFYVSTTTGLYVKSQENESRFEKLADGDFYNFLEYKIPNGKSILLNACKFGVVEISQKNILNTISGSEDIECKTLYQPSENQSLLFIGGRNYFSKFQYSDHTFKLKINYENAKGTIKSIVSGLHGKIYACAESRAIYETDLDGTNTKLDSTVTSTKLPNSSFSLFKLDNKIFFTGPTGLYEIMENSKWVSSPILKYNFDNKATNIISLISDNNNKIWLNVIYNNKFQTFVATKQPDLFYRVETKSISKLNTEQVNDFLIDNSTICFSTNLGVLKYDIAKSVNYKPRFNAYISGVTQKNGDVIFKGFHLKQIGKNNYFSLIQPKQQIPIIAFKNNSVTFEFAASVFSNPEETYYQTYLEKYDSTYTNWSRDFKRTFTNLEGNFYTFHVRVKDEEGNISNQCSYSFIIESPWYKTFVGITLIVVCSILLLYFLVIQIAKYRTRKIEAEKKVLELKVSERTYELEISNKEVLQQKNDLEIKNQEIDLKNHEILQSIEYSLHIQQSILPDKELIYESLPNCFVLYKPKDIVSGDFFAFTISEKNENQFLIAAADCTGHGVPGALMSMLGSNILYQIINDRNITTPSEILYHLNLGVTESLKQNKNAGNDGMDIALLSLKYFEENNTKFIDLEFSGAYRPLYIIRNTTPLEVLEIKANKFPIGGQQIDEERIYTNHHFVLNSGDTVYIFSDGYADQFGGEFGKKMTTKKFKEFLLSNHQLDMKEQDIALDTFFNTWRGNNEQVDDVCVIGIRV